MAQVNLMTMKFCEGFSPWLLKFIWGNRNYVRFRKACCKELQIDG